MVAMICAKLKSEEKKNEFIQEFIHERLINGKVGFLDTIKKGNLKTGIKSKKVRRKNCFNSSRGLPSICHI